MPSVITRTESEEDGSIRVYVKLMVLARVAERCSEFQNPKRK